MAIIEESVHRLSTEEYEHIVGTGALEELHVELLDGLLVDIEDVDVTTVAALPGL